MIARIKTALVAGIAFGGLALVGSASAMPAQGPQAALALPADAAQIENVRLVCPPFRPCFYTRGYYGYRGYGYGYRGYGYGYRPFYRRRFFY